MPRSDLFDNINDSGPRRPRRIPRHAASQIRSSFRHCRGRPSAATTRWIGTLELQACGSAGALCGQLDRPLDPSGTVPGTVSVYFEFYPHSGAGAGRDVRGAATGGAHGRLLGTWPEGVDAATARITETLAGETVVAEMPAP